MSNVGVWQIGYVGSTARTLHIISNINQNGDFPNFTNILQLNTIGTSNYNALQTTFRMRTWHGLSSQFAYTWAPYSRHIFTVVSAVTAPFQTLWSVPLDGGAPRPLIRFDDPFTTFGRGAFAARGSTIYVTLLRSESDVWTADLVRR